MSKTYILINDLGGGGAERQVNYLFQNAVAEHIFILNNRNIFPIPQEKVTPLLKNVTYWRIARYFIPIIAAIKLARIVKRDDTVISFLELSNITNLMLKVFLRKKHKAILSVRIHPDIYQTHLTGSILVNLMKAIYPLGDLIVANSSDCCADLVKKLHLPEKKVVHIPNMLDVKKILQMGSQNLSGENLCLITIGRLSGQKKIDAQLYLLKDLLPEFPELKLYVLGEGPLRQRLISLADQLKLKVGTDTQEQAQVYFLGHDKEALRYVTEKSIFLLTSTNEGMPNVIIEALAKKAVVLSSNCPSGPKEILAPDEYVDTEKQAYYGQFGILLPVLNHQVWLTEIRKILKDEHLRKKYSVKALTRALEFEIPEIIERWKKAIGN